MSEQERDARERDAALAEEAAEIAHDEDESSSGGPSPLLLGIVGFLVMGGLAALLLSPAAPAYTVELGEVVDDPAAHEGRTLTVEGDLTPGSIQFREEPCEWRFRIQQGEQELPVAFPQCTVPDTFRDGFGVQVTVRGRIGEGGAFHADQIMTRCPSKYEMREMEEAGEAAPHAAPGA